MSEHLAIWTRRPMAKFTSTPVGFVEALAQFGSAGRRLTEIGASEGASGNLSVFMRGPMDRHPSFTQSEAFELPFVVPELARGWCVVTGSGTRSRDLEHAPTACLGCLEFDGRGQSALLWYSPTRQFARITSEFNSHLSVHRDHVGRHDLTFHAVAHAQPRNVTYLSHLAAYRDATYLNQRLLRWQPETILNLPEGIAIVPFLMPSGRELMLASEAALRTHRIAIWSKHGVMARSYDSLLHATDLIEYLETAAAYECLDKRLGGEAEGLTNEELRQICATYSIEQALF
jgi:rhamnulose-1-phosphate aldolase